MVAQELNILQDFEKDSLWFHKNIGLLRQQNFTGKFVAIFNEKPIASDTDVDNVIKIVEKKSISPAAVFIEFVYPEGYTLLL